MTEPEVCEELDRTILEFMNSLKELSSLRNKYRDVVKEGYFAMSQARHAMGGPRFVSSLQYDSAMKSLVHLHLNTEETEKTPSSYDDLLSIGQTGGKIRAEFEVKRIEPGKGYRAKSKSEDESAESLLRRRKGEESGPIEDVPTAPGKIQESCEEAKDPIKWFGILVPQNLRRAQQCFVQAVQHSAELAAAQMRVELAHRKYQELSRNKTELN